MGKLTVESIINIYGSGVKEIKAYNEAKRAKAEEFLQVEPVAFSLSDEPDVLRIYVDKESAEASLDGTLKEDTAKSQRIWDEQEKTVTMTRHQWNRLVCYLLMSTNYREGEAKAWAELAEEKEEDGSPKYKNAAENAEYWREILTDIEEIRKKIDEG